MGAVEGLKNGVRGPLKGVEVRVRGEEEWGSKVRLPYSTFYFCSRSCNL